MRKTGKRFGKTNESIGSESKISVEAGTEETTFDKGKMITPFFKRETKVTEISVKKETAISKQK